MERVMKRGCWVTGCSALLVVWAGFGGAVFAQGLGAPPKAQGAAKAEAAPLMDPAEEHFRKGNALYKEGKWAEAEGEYEKALSLRKTHDVAANLGHAELRQGKWTEAAEHLAFSVRSWPMTGNAEKRAFAQKGLEEARGKVGALEVRVSAAGAEVMVDGKRVGLSPLEVEVFVEPGAHGVEAKLAGHEDAREAVEVGAGASKVVELSLKRKAEAGPVGPVEPPVKKRSLVPAVVLGGVAVAGAGAAIGMFVGVNGKVVDARDTAQQIRAEGGTCKEGAQVHSRCELLESDKSTGRTLAGFVVGSTVVGGLAAASAIVYLAWPAPSGSAKNASARVGFGPVIGSGGRVVISGSF